MRKRPIVLLTLIVLLAACVPAAGTNSPQPAPVESASTLVEPAAMTPSASPIPESAPASVPPSEMVARQWRADLLKALHP